jgi:hypothetical protein
MSVDQAKSKVFVVESKSNHQRATILTDMNRFGMENSSDENQDSRMISEWRSENLPTMRKWKVIV